MIIELALEEVNALTKTFANMIDEVRTRIDIEKLQKRIKKLEKKK